MSTLQRYSAIGGDDYMRQVHDGPYVLATEAAALVERLESERDEWKRGHAAQVEAIGWHTGAINEWKVEVADLKDKLAQSVNERDAALRLYEHEKSVVSEAVESRNNAWDTAKENENLLEVIREDLSAANAQIARMREALEKVRDFPEPPPHFTEEAIQACYKIALSQCRKEAKAALTATGKDGQAEGGQNAGR